MGDIYTQSYNGPYTLDFNKFKYKDDVNSSGVNVDIPEKAGIYCMYSLNTVNGKRCVNRLEYVGKALNLKTRIREHCRVPDLDVDGRPVDKNASPCEYLYNHDDPKADCFYTYALLDGRSIAACEAALIKKFKPEINTKCTKTLGCHDSVKVSITGKYVYEPMAVDTYLIDKDKDDENGN